MSFYFIIFILIFIVVYILFSYRYHIDYYFKFLKGDLKYKKDVKDNLKLDLKTRMIENDAIDSIIKFLNNKLEEKGYVYKGEFKIPDNLRRKLIYSKFSEKSIKELFELITEFMGIKSDGVILEVKNVSSKIERKYAGLYYEGNTYSSKKISIFVKPDYSFETVISILIHESTHFFLFSNNIKIEEEIYNEFLTDIATIYLGFGKYILEGYKQNKKIVFMSEFNRTVSEYKIGYINYSDAKYAIKQVRKLRKIKF